MSQPKLFLFVDDSETRHRRFYDICGHLDVITFHAYTASQAIKLLQDTPFEQVFSCVWLDHDLGGPETGYTVAEYIALRLPKSMWPKNVVLHTWNNVGAKRMEAVLRDNGYTNVKRTLFQYITSVLGTSVVDPTVCPQCQHQTHLPNLCSHISEGVGSINKAVTHMGCKCGGPEQ